MTKLIDEKWKLFRCIISTLLAVWRHVWITSVQKFLSQQSDNLTTPQSHDATISPRHNLTMPQSHLEGAAHLTVELVLLLCHLHVILRSRLHTEECVFTKNALVSLNFNLSVIPCICSFQWSTVTLKWWYNDLNCPRKVRVDTPSIGIEVAEKIVWVSLILLKKKNWDMI